MEAVTSEGCLRVKHLNKIAIPLITVVSHCSQVLCKPKNKGVNLKNTFQFNWKKLTPGQFQVNKSIQVTTTVQNLSFLRIQVFDMTVGKSLSLSQT